MTAAEQPSLTGATKDDPTPLTMADVQRFVEQTGQRELVLRWAERALVVEACGQRCESLPALAALTGMAAATGSHSFLRAHARRARRLHGPRRPGARARWWRQRTASASNPRGV